MQIKITGISYDTLVTVLADQGFGLVETKDGRGLVASVDVWTQSGPEGPNGYGVGLINRQLGSFPSYELVIDSGWCQADRLTPLMAALIAKGR